MGQGDSIEQGSREYICSIIVIAAKSGDDSLTELRWLPKEARIIGTGLCLEDFQKDGVNIEDGNIILNVNGTASTLAAIIREMPLLVWIHSVTSGVEHILCPELVDNPDITLTNAKGVYSRLSYSLHCRLYVFITFP
jgi:hypothetical protein